MRFRRKFRPRIVRRKSRFRTLFDWVLVVAIFAMLFVVGARIEYMNQMELWGVAKIVDGDTIELKNERIRLKGIDAPEYNQSCKIGGQEVPCGRQSRLYLERIIANRTITCTGWERDKYGRLLVNCRAGTTDINSAMVEAGWAVAYGNFEGEEAAARSARRGIWAGEFDLPRDWRERTGSAFERQHDYLGSVIAFVRQLIAGSGSNR